MKKKTKMERETRMTTRATAKKKPTVRLQKRIMKKTPNRIDDSLGSSILSKSNRGRRIWLAASFLNATHAAKGTGQSRAISRISN